MTSGRRLPLVHPSEILRDEFLTPMDLSVYRLARPIRVLRPQLNDILLGRYGVTTDTVLRLGPNHATVRRRLLPAPACDRFAFSQRRGYAMKCGSVGYRPWRNRRSPCLNTNQSRNFAS